MNTQAAIRSSGTLVFLLICALAGCNEQPCVSPGSAQICSGGVCPVVNTDFLLVDYVGNFCPACRRIEPYINTIAEQYQGVVTVRKINLDQPGNEHLAPEVEYTPTVVLLYKGKEVGRWVGYKDLPFYTEQIDQAIREHDSADNSSLAAKP